MRGKEPFRSIINQSERSPEAATLSSTHDVGTPTLSADDICLGAQSSSNADVGRPSIDPRRQQGWHCRSSSSRQGHVIPARARACR
ncbi:hypothetical protein HGRIS_001591 [Hohenbuehelia grisea]|uniref:Uncharacterized protein n=1 Tax=Hohenbuehelia grisea TaxID=104357 RepID=A0ABR3JIJ4_9AGAR